MRLTRPTRLALASLLAAAALPAAAQEAAATAPRSSYVELGYADTTWYDESLDGYAIKGQIAFTDAFYMLVDYSSGTLDTPAGDIELQPFNVGLGYRHAVAGSTDLILEAGSLSVETKFQDQTFSNTGWRAAAGVSAALGTRVDIEAKAMVSSVEEFDSIVGGQVALAFNINATWAVTARHTVNAVDFSLIGDDGALDITSVGVRANF
jgi:hypothetical protein